MIVHYPFPGFVQRGMSHALSCITYTMLSVKRFAIESAKTGVCQGITEAGQGISENKRGFSLEGIWPPPWGGYLAPGSPQLPGINEV